MEIVIGDRKITNLSKINILLGRNGCGKSRILRQIDEQGLIDGNAIEYKKYVTPERGGNLQHDGGVEAQLFQNRNTYANQRRTNFYISFRQQTVAFYEELIRAVHQTVEEAYEKGMEGALTTSIIHGEINELLDNIHVEPDRKFLNAFSRQTGEKVTFDNISSGEKELISIAIEILHFEKLKPDDSKGVFLFDEPDVHLHPDLQVRIAEFLVRVVERSDTTFVIATHSPVFLSALERIRFRRNTLH